MEIFEVLVTEKANAMFAENDMAARYCILNINEYRHSHLLVENELIEESDIPICEASVLFVSSLRVSFYAHDTVMSAARQN